jgi:glutamate formiminotransferase/formiminotetrahydrofolate cyclodeaminase
MLVQKTVQDFLEELASDSPAPGGGSVAALCGALGAALVAMVCRLTVDKPKYAQVSDELGEVMNRSDELQRTFSELVERDTQAFQAVMSAFRMPKESDDQKAARSSAIQQATRGATEVPLEVHNLTVDLIQLAHRAAEKGNVNSISDAGVAAEMARAAARGAALNVAINLGGLKDHSYVQKVRKELDTNEQTIKGLYDSVKKLVDQKIA